ncbi:hypothetical protein H4582DRAFT_1954844, partial [Lactarius indigo]
MPLFYTATPSSISAVGPSPPLAQVQHQQPWVLPRGAANAAGRRVGGKVAGRSRWRRRVSRPSRRTLVPLLPSRQPCDGPTPLTSSILLLMSPSPPLRHLSRNHVHVYRRINPRLFFLLPMPLCFRRYLLAPICFAKASFFPLFTLPLRASTGLLGFVVDPCWWA